MRKMRIQFLMTLLVLLGLTLGNLILGDDFAQLNQEELHLPQLTAEGFRVPQPNAVLPFPETHGAHPDFRIEWWYLTGHLEDEGGSAYGYQATFFRYGGPLKENSEAGRAALFAPVTLGASQLYMAHMAVTDVRGQRFYYEERLARDGWDAHAEVGRLAVRQGSWSLVAEEDPVDPRHPTMQLEGGIRGEVAFSLELSAAKPLIRFGQDGLSRKGPDPASVSYYLSFTRLQTTGRLRIGERQFRVTGSSWMDHEIASNQLSEGLVGWDWTAIQFDNGWELKAYRLRRADGSADRFSAWIWISPEGEVSSVYAPAFQWQDVDYWTSPVTGARYPTTVKLIGPARRSPDGANATYMLEPLLDSQELSGRGGGIAYWEGACRVLNTDGEVVGRAYLELTGYAGTMEGRF